MIGRQTLPIVWPKYARKTIFVGLLCWSAVLAWIWKLGVITSLALIVLGAITGVRFLVFDTIHSDQVTFYVYNVSVLG